LIIDNRLQPIEDAGFSQTGSRRRKESGTRKNDILPEISWRQKQKSQ